VAADPDARQALQLAGTTQPANDTATSSTWRNRREPRPDGASASPETGPRYGCPGGVHSRAHSRSAPTGRADGRCRVGRVVATRILRTRPACQSRCQARSQQRQARRPSGRQPLKYERTRSDRTTASGCEFASTPRSRCAATAGSARLASRAGVRPPCSISARVDGRQQHQERRPRPDHRSHTRPLVGQRRSWPSVVRQSWCSDHGTGRPTRSRRRLHVGRRLQAWWWRHAATRGCQDET
jgi:hypothetical protein